jgi:hypothetical protein
MLSQCPLVSFSEIDFYSALRQVPIADSNQRIAGIVEKAALFIENVFRQ